LAAGSQDRGAAVAEVWVGVGLADFSGSKPCPRGFEEESGHTDAKDATREKFVVFCCAGVTGKERVGSVVMARQRKCCRCPQPSEVDSDGHGEKLLLLRPWQVGNFSVLEGIIDCVEKESPD